MKILIGSRRHDALAKARDWFTSLAARAALTELFEWARFQQSHWGECFAFVEPDVPGIGRFKTANIDFILAFEDRVAVCEVKDHGHLSFAQEALNATLRQCGNSLDLVKQHLFGGRVLSKESLRGFLFIPQLSTDAIAVLLKQQWTRESLRHIAIAGGDPSRLRPSLPTGHPVYLPAVISSRLEELPPLSRRGFVGGAQRYLKALTEGAPFSQYADLPSDEVIPEFEEFEKSVEYLLKFADHKWELRVPPDHVAGLRPRTLKRFLMTLDKMSVVELQGPFGIGKSALVREAFSNYGDVSSWQLPVAVRSITKTPSFAQLLRDLIRSFGGVLDEWDDETALLDRLFSTEGLVWIRGYDSNSAPAISRLIDEIRRAPFEPRCAVIVESRRPLTFARSGDVPRCSVVVYPFRPPQIHEILSQVRPANPVPPVIYDSNPKLALSRWRSSTSHEYESALISEFDWVERDFEGLEREIAQFLVILVAALPIEIEFGIVNDAAKLVFPSHLPSTIDRALTNVTSHLVRGGFLTFRAFDSAPLRRYWSTLPEVRLSAIWNVNPALATYIRSSLSGAQLEALQKATRSALAQLQPTHSRTATIVSIVNGDLQPLLDSANREGPIGLLLLGAWLDMATSKTVRDDVSLHSLYLERVARFVAGTYSDRSHKNWLPRVSELGAPPDKSSNLEIYLSRVIDLSFNCLASEEADLERFVKVSLTVDDRNVMAESLCWLYFFSSLEHDLAIKSHDRFIELFRHHASMPLATNVKVWLYRMRADCLQSRGRQYVSEHREEIEQSYLDYFQAALSTDASIFALARTQFLYRSWKPILDRQRRIDRAVAAFIAEGNPNHFRFND